MRRDNPIAHIMTAMGSVIDVITWLEIVVEDIATPVEESLTSALPQYHRALM